MLQRGERWHSSRPRSRGNHLEMRDHKWTENVALSSGDGSTTPTHPDTFLQAATTCLSMDTIIKFNTLGEGKELWLVFNLLHSSSRSFVCGSTLGESHAGQCCRLGKLMMFHFTRSASYKMRPITRLTTGSRLIYLSLVKSWRSRTCFQLQRLQWSRAEPAQLALSSTQ